MNFHDLECFHRAAGTGCTSPGEFPADVPPHRPEEHRSGTSGIRSYDTVSGTGSDVRCSLSLSELESFPDAPSLQIPERNRASFFNRLNSCRPFQFCFPFCRKLYCLHVLGALFRIYRFPHSLHNYYVLMHPVRQPWNREKHSYSACSHQL